MQHNRKKPPSNSFREYGIGVSEGGFALLTCYDRCGKSVGGTHGSDRYTVTASWFSEVHGARVLLEVPVNSKCRYFRVERTRPIVAVRASVVELVVPTVARSGQEETSSNECVSGLFVFGAEGMPKCKPIASSVLSHA